MKLQFTIIIILLSGLCSLVFGQEGLINDIKGCDRFYYVGKDIIKQIQKEKDTLTYYYDPELIIYFNKDSKKLSPNSFYIFNHGYNKIIAIHIVEIELEAIDEYGKKKHIFSSDQNLMMLYNDSIPRCNYQVAGFKITIPGYNKISVRAMHVQISYYNNVFDKWFLNKKDFEPRLSIPKQMINFILGQY